LGDEQSDILPDGNQMVFLEGLRVRHRSLNNIEIR
jgi:hypothetical protein